MKEKSQNKTSIGGQAVIEGVMMRGKTAMATAVRDERGEVLVETKRISPPSKKYGFLKLPIIRGVVAFFTSMVGGTKCLMRSATVFGEEESSSFDKWLSKKTGINATDIAIYLGMFLGLALSLFLFFFLPQTIADLFKFIPNNSVWYYLLEGLIRISIFILYILLTSLIKDVRRTYMYHGAEHKTISCYESGLDLTVENVRSCSRVHDRCGTTFMFIVMIISILVFATINGILGSFGIVLGGRFSKLYRFLIKLLALPLVAGVSYEILKLLSKTTSKWVYVFKLPGLLLQRVTTKEPTGDMIEVAIKAFTTVLEMDADETIKEVEFNVFGGTNVLLTKVKKLLSGKGIDDSDAEWIVCSATGYKRSELSSNLPVDRDMTEKAFMLSVRRAEGTPLWYVIGDTDFYGYKIGVNENVLIPRPETEELCSYALSYVKESSSVLDLCTGSGAIAIAIKLKTNAKVTAVDISSEALVVASSNAKLNGADIEFIKSDMFTNLKGSYDFILTNPPYVKTADLETLQKEVKKEPMLALDGGKDGLKFYRIIAENAYNFLNENGMVFAEFGIGQSTDIKEIFKSVNQYKNIQIIKDINGIDRIIKAVKI